MIAAYADTSHMNTLSDHTQGMTTLRLGIIGLGEHALRSHIDPLEKIDRARIVGAFDPSEAARTAFAERFPEAQLHESMEDLLADENVDAVVVCSPDRFHAPALIAAVAAGKHALVEKPLADEGGETLASVAGALQAADREGIIVSSCHPRRYDRPYMWLRDHMDELRGRLGDLLEIRLDFFYHRPSKEGLHHGLLIDHINHEIDLVHYLVGMSAFTAHKLYDSQLRYAASGVRDDGIAFHFCGSRHLTRRVYSETVQLRFEQGVAIANTETGIVTIEDYDTGEVTTQECGTTDYEGRFGAVNQNFVDACLGAADPYLSANELLVNTEIGIDLTHTDSYRYYNSPYGGRVMPDRPSWCFVRQVTGSDDVVTGDDLRQMERAENFLYEHAPDGIIAPAVAWSEEGHMELSWSMPGKYALELEFMEDGEVEVYTHIEGTNSTMELWPAHEDRVREVFALIPRV